MDMGQAPQVERRYREEHGKLVVEWLRQHYEIGDRGHTILKATVFHDYLVMCRTTGIESTTAAVFGRFVKKAFPTVKCSRKGLDGKSLHCYRCLKRIDDDSKTTTAAAASSEESSPRMPHPATSVDDSANTRTASYVRYGSSSAGSLEGGSGSDSTDEGYDDELRYTIEELSRAAGDALYSDQMQSTAIKTGNPATATATNNNWPTAASSASNPYHSNSFNSYNLPVEPCTATAKLLDLPEARSPPPTPNVNNGVTYYPSQGREYLLPFDPELASPSHHPYRTAPMRPTYLPQPPFDPLDSYNSSAARQHPAYPQSTFATIPSSSATTSYSPRTISDTGFANAGTWPTPECDDGSLHELTHSDQDYSMTQLAAPRSGLTSYTTSFTTTSTNFTTSGLGDVLSTKTFYFKPTTSSGIKDVGMIGEPWTTSNPTPYPIANGLDMVESSPDFFPGRTLTPPFHPVHTTQSCPVHSQPSQFGPIHSVSSSTTSTYRPPMHMRD